MDVHQSRRTARSGARALSILAALALFGCGGLLEHDGAVDDRDAVFLRSGQSVALGLDEGSPEALGVLRVVNESDRHTLEVRVGLAVVVVDNLLAYRVGDDGYLGSYDDETFDTLAELDAIPFVGEAVAAKLLEFAQQHQFVPNCANQCVDDTHLLDCAAGGAVVACPLGCHDGVCPTFAPSNLIPEWVGELLAPGVTATLTVPAYSTMFIDVGHGIILTNGNQITRATETWDPNDEYLRDRLPFFGVIGGIGFYPTRPEPVLYPYVASTRVLVVAGIKVGKGATLRINQLGYLAVGRLGENPAPMGLVILSLGGVDIRGTINVSGVGFDGPGASCATRNDRLSPLTGGCGNGGVGGGGAVQITSLSRIEIDSRGGNGPATIDARAVAGGTPGAGTSGGSILLEAPTVTVSPGSQLLAFGFGGAAGKIRINAAADAITTDGATISPLPSLGAPNLDTSLDPRLDDFVGEWRPTNNTDRIVFRIIGDELWGVFQASGTLVARLDPDGIVRGWWSENPDRMPDAHAGAVELRLSRSGNSYELIDGSRRKGTNGPATAWPLQRVGLEPAGTFDARFADTATFRRHPHW